MLHIVWPYISANWNNKPCTFWKAPADIVFATESRSATMKVGSALNFIIVISTGLWETENEFPMHRMLSRSIRLYPFSVSPGSLNLTYRSIIKLYTSFHHHRRHHLFVIKQVQAVTWTLDTDTCDWTAGHIVHLQVPLVMYSKTHT